MGRETSSKPSPKASTPGVKPAMRGTKPSVSGPNGPIDSDWPDRERAAKGRPLPEDGDDDAVRDDYGDPRKVQDQGILESLGEAVSSPVRDETQAAENPSSQTEVDVSNQAAIERWSKALGTTDEALMNAVNRVGRRIDKIKDWLGAGGMAGSQGGG